MLIIYKKVGGILKKIISILLVLCLSGCTVLDFVTDDNQNQLLVVGMVEDGRDLGGSHYLIKKIKQIF